MRRGERNFSRFKLTTVSRKFYFSNELTPRENGTLKQELKLPTASRFHVSHTLFNTDIVLSSIVSFYHFYHFHLATCVAKTNSSVDFLISEKTLFFSLFSSSHFSLHLCSSLCHLCRISVNAKKRPRALPF